MDELPPEAKDGQYKKEDFHKLTPEHFSSGNLESFSVETLTELFGQEFAHDYHAGRLATIFKDSPHDTGYIAHLTETYGKEFVGKYKAKFEAKRSPPRE